MLLPAASRVAAPRASPQQQFLWFWLVSPHRSFLPFLVPRSQIWDVLPGELWGPSLYSADGPPRFVWRRVGSPPALPSRSTSLPRATPGAEATLESRPDPVRGALCPSRAAALRPLSPVPSPVDQARRAAAWPAEGPVGPEMWHCQGGERQTGREALQVYPVLKENKIFSWETFPLCFSPPAHFSCSLLLGCLPGSAPCLLTLETPPRSQGCGCEFGLPGAQAVQRLARPCMPSVQPLPHPLGQREGQRLAVWLQVHGESRWPVSQLCLCAVQAQPWVCSPARLRHSVLCAESLLPAFTLREDRIHRVVFGVLALILYPHPCSIPLFLPVFSALCISREVSLAPLKRITPRGCVAS